MKFHSFILAGKLIGTNVISYVIRNETYIAIIAM